MTINDPPPPTGRPHMPALGRLRWLPLLILALVLVAFALLASQCTDDDSARNRPTYQGAAPGSSPPAAGPAAMS